MSDTDSHVLEYEGVFYARPVDRGIILGEAGTGRTWNRQSTICWARRTRARTASTDISESESKSSTSSRRPDAAHGGSRQSV